MGEWAGVDLVKGAFVEVHRYLNPRWQARLRSG